MYNNIIYKGVYFGYLKCAHSARKIGFIKFKITDKIPWFFQVDFSKFHDFSRFLGLFPNSMIFPGLEKVFFIFQVSMIFPEAGNPDPRNQSQQCVGCEGKDDHDNHDQDQSTTLTWRWIRHGPEVNKYLWEEIHLSTGVFDGWVFENHFYWHESILCVLIIIIKTPINLETSQKQIWNEF